MQDENMQDVNILLLLLFILQYLDRKMFKI